MLRRFLFRLFIALAVLMAAIWVGSYWFRLDGTILSSHWPGRAWVFSTYAWTGRIQLTVSRRTGEQFGDEPEQTLGRRSTWRSYYLVLDRHRCEEDNSASVARPKRYYIYRDDEITFPAWVPLLTILIPVGAFLGRAALRRRAARSTVPGTAPRSAHTACVTGAEQSRLMGLFLRASLTIGVVGVLLWPISYLLEFHAQIYPLFMRAAGESNLYGFELQLHAGDGGLGGSVTRVVDRKTGDAFTAVRIGRLRRWGPFVLGSGGQGAYPAQALNAPPSTYYVLASNPVSVRMWFVVPLLWIVPFVAFLRGPFCRYVRRRQNRCIHCGYALTGLTEPRCPECGLPFVSGASDAAATAARAAQAVARAGRGAGPPS